MKKNILFIAHDNSLFGANQSLMNMVSSLKEYDIEVKVVFPESGPICEHFDALGVEYYIVRYKTESVDPNKSVKSKIFNALRFLNKCFLNSIALGKLQKIVNKHQINIIHSNSSIIGIGEELAKKVGARHVWHLREYIDLDHGMDVFGGIQKLKDRIIKSDRVICISEGIRSYFNVDHNSIVLYNSVRKIANSYHIKVESSYFLFCGSLIKNKGAEEAIMAFHHISHGIENLELWIAGTGEYLYEIHLKDLVSKLEIDGKVRFLGFRTDSDKLMANSLALLMCSTNEALGRVTIEAMLNSCLVIGFDNAGTSELLDNGTTGILYHDREELQSHMSQVANGTGDDFEHIRVNAYNYARANFLEERYGISLVNYYDSFAS